MSTKLNNLSELTNVLKDNDKIIENVYRLMPFFKLERFLSVFNKAKNKGVEVSTLLISLITFRLSGKSIPLNLAQRLSFLPKIDDNTYYRFLNNSRMNWRSLLIRVAKQFTSIVKSKTDNKSKITCFVIDDTDIEKTGKTIEFAGKIFNHVTKTYPFGFKMLLLAFWDGTSSYSIDFSFHREKGKKGNFGLNDKELKNQFSKKRESKLPSYKRVKELDSSKITNTITMLKRAVKNGYIATYVLMDSWFVNDQMIKGIRAIKNGAMHILGMCKMDNRKYSINNQELNSHQIVAKHSRKKGKYSKKFKSHYFSMQAEYKGETVKLFYVQYNHSKNWNLLLTTDLKLSFVQTVELYQIRWTIEVMFKECKQYLGLGRSQNTDFDGQIADTTLALITHTILTLQKRFSAYETMGGLFRDTQQLLLEMNLWERLVKVFIKMVLELIEILNIDMEEVIYKLLQNDSVSNKLLTMLKAMVEVNDNPKKVDNPVLINVNI